MKSVHPWLFFVLLCVLSIMAAWWLRSGTDARPFAVVARLSTVLHNWLVDWEDRIFDVVDRSTPSNSAAKSYSPTTTGLRVPWLDHTANDRQACGRPPTKSRTDTNSQLVYTWVDETGQTHMSDKPPQDQSASVADFGMSKQDFTYEIIPDGVELPLNFQGQLAASSKRMYDAWNFFLGEENLRQSKIQLLLMGDPNRFDAYYAEASPASGSRNVAGFYRIDKNQAVVKYDAKRPGQGLRTTFHEVSHLITASHLGPTPSWLTEGLAEYFEMMQVAGQGGTIHPNHAHIKLLRTTPLPRLQDYLAIDRPDWYGEYRDRNYAMAWSLINFLMAGSPGKYALQDTMQLAHQNFCKPFSAAAALANAYPGGIRQLEIDWRNWLASGNYQIQQI
jgi:hypothetical protein